MCSTLYKQLGLSLAYVNLKVTHRCPLHLNIYNTLYVNSKA